MTFSLILQGMRLKTLVAGIMPVMAAWALASKTASSNGYFVMLCLALAVFIQIATNFYNDAVDFKKGADEFRVGPERITTQGKSDFSVVMNIGHFFIFLSILVGIPLVLQGGALYMVGGVLSLYFAYGYTGGPYPLAYLGLGELFVFIFFGLVATVGSFGLITDMYFNTACVVLGIQLGLLSSVLIAINNFRDKEEDKKIGKLTLATKMSRKSYLRLIDFFLFFPYFCVLYYVFFVDLVYMLNIFSISIAHNIRNELSEITDMAACNKLLAKSAKHLALFTFIFCLICLWK